MQMKCYIVAIVTIYLVIACNELNPHRENIPLEQASGITRHKDHLLLVDDEIHGAYYKYALRGLEKDLIPIDRNRLIRISFGKAFHAQNLESIDVLADGRIVALSGRLRALVGVDGIIAEYDNIAAELGGIGLEGLAVHRINDDKSIIAVLWEGGFISINAVPMAFYKHYGRHPLKPMIFLHKIYNNSRLGGLEDLDVIELQVPLEQVNGETYHFRAPDLVWHHWRNSYKNEIESGFIVLLASESHNPNPTLQKRHMHLWLQRFNRDGRRYGDPFDLRAYLKKTEKTAKFAAANWEGIGWFEEGKRLIIVHDEPSKGIPHAYILDLPEILKAEN